jgi:hypothetical protein
VKEGRLGLGEARAVAEWRGAAALLEVQFPARAARAEREARALAALLLPPPAPAAAALAATASALLHARRLHQVTAHPFFLFIYFVEDQQLRLHNIQPQ